MGRGSLSEARQGAETGLGTPSSGPLGKGEDPQVLDSQRPSLTVGSVSTGYSLIFAPSRLYLQFSCSVVSDSVTPRQASLSIANSRSLPKLMSLESVMPSSHFILCHPLLLLPSIFPSIRVFSQ